MNTNENDRIELDPIELDPEELDAVNGGSIWDDVVDFGKGLWGKIVNVVKKLKNWG